MVGALERAQRSGALAADADPRALAALLKTVLYGLAVRSRAGASVEELRGIATSALDQLR